MLREVTYPIAPRGLETSFVESEVPPDYATKFRNRFINAAGGAEKRQGITQWGSTVPTTPTLDAIHELIKSDGTAIVLLSGQGTIWSFNETTGVSTQVHTGLDGANPLQSVQMGERLIFSNGVDRNFYTDDGTAFTELRAIIEQGELSGQVSAASTDDTDIANWVTDTDVAANDIVFNITKGAYGIITAVAATALSHTTIGSAANGVGFVSGGTNHATGDRYMVIDAVELNVIPTDGDDDNVATLGVGSSATGIRVSAVSDWTLTQIKAGDFIHNTTRSILTQVTAVATAQVRVVGASGQTNGDSITLFKAAMPITKRSHVHMGRLWMIDARDERLVRISGADDPQDLTTDAGTLDSTTFSFGMLQPQGDAAVSMGSYQRFFVIAGERYLYAFQGTQPIADVSALATDTQTRTSMDFDIIGLFPQGVVSGEGLISIGNDLVFLTADGLQSMSLAGDASTLGRANISEAIKASLRSLIKNTSSAQIKVVHYPRRSWLLIKIGSEVYCYNYTAFFGDDQLSQGQFGTSPGTKGGSWSLFDGKFARQNAYYVRRDGTMLVAGNGGKLYRFDQGDYSDDGEIFTTEYQTGWLTLAKGPTVKTRQLHYVKPVFDAGDVISYNLRAEAGYNAESTDTATVITSGASLGIGVAVIGEHVIGGTGIVNPKVPLRVRGEQIRLHVQTTDSKGPDVLSRSTLYYTQHGKR